MPGNLGPFKGELRFLSNFYPVDIEFDGLVYPSVEHAYVAAKTLDPFLRSCISDVPTPGQVKRMGRDIALRPDWDEVKVRIMDTLITKKFENPELRKKLLDTGDLNLVEFNEWGDTFWGVCSKTGKGRNTLGILLMNLRDRIADNDVFVV